ncbi:2-hydroxyacid dehydrogenase [Massilia litorea]|jgi:glyoxylate/hydroxypyruvate reductase A|uniref:Glyoxylate/hydroxypyruvate reductase A n=1 Tax=Massilia litorea TaxID=2769491 RepID=A0A7L9U6R4_9BURK|nr:glyoxylate/hydroxypyruvate reductase A [Massilia litorea]QOL50763.1 glyoxylate/hydroxypyruvate reductase A [Massilia litorea]
MRILLYRSDGQTGPWAEDLARALPGVDTLAWQEGDLPAACDYAVLWNPSAGLLAQLDKVKAVFLMGAGADALLKFGDALPSVPIVRLGDAGMAVQMAEYVSYATLRYFRRFDEYEEQARHGLWAPLPPHVKEDFTVGVMGLGKLGLRVVDTLRGFGFPVRGWSRTQKDIQGVACFAGMETLDDFLRGTRVLVSLLPLTPETNNLLDRRRLATLPQGAYIINVARGAQLAEPDLLTLIRAGHIAGATLDVFRNEPLPAPHPFWDEPRITITPHISAVTIRAEAVRQIAFKIAAFEANEPVDDIVDRNLGY